MRVLAFGTFDLLHPGHEFVLKEAQRRGELHVVVARDANVKKIKGHEPSDAENVRLKNVRAVVPDAEVFLGDPDDFLAPVLRVKPDLIVLGYDQALPPGVTEKDLGCPIERLPAFEPQKHKSSLLRKKEEH